MKVKMSDVWDRTTEVLSGRGAVLAAIAALTIFLPSVVRDAYVAYATKGTVAFAVIGGLLSLIVLAVALWGQLAILAAASDPAIDRGGAQARATARLPAAIGVSLLLLLILVVAILPIAVAIAQSGVDWAAMTGGTMTIKPTMSPGLALFLGGYGLVLGVATVFVGARLALVNPIVLHERRGAGAIAHSWALTRGHSWRILGVFILFLIVLLVAAGAAQAVTGIVFRLILGADALPTVSLLAGIVGGIVSTAFSVVALVFIAQLYVALAPRQPVTA